MENDKQEKAAFFAQYMNQDVLVPHQFYKSTIELTGYRLKHSKYTDSHLLLTYLRDITDDHAIEVGNILDVGMITEQLKRWIDQSFNYNQWSHRTRNIVEAADFLRRNGYLLPYAGYTTDQILSMGWAKLKQQ